MTINEIIEKNGVDFLNTLTKYLSILTYHELGDNGVLNDIFSENCIFPDKEICIISEKIDGTNTRIISYNDDFIIGSREQLLYAKNDRFADPAQNIVKAVKDIAYKINNYLGKDNMFHVVFGETYGGAVTSGSKNYTTDKTLGFRVFDKLSFTDSELMELMKKDIRMISEEREKLCYQFYEISKLKEFCQSVNIMTVEYIDHIIGSKMPRSLKETFDWLQQYRKSVSGINNNGNSEGVVVRTQDRKIIRKLRFEDYERTRRKGRF
jgi:hypothetical protein